MKERIKQTKGRIRVMHIGSIIQSPRIIKGLRRVKKVLGRAEGLASHTSRKADDLRDWFGGRNVYLSRNADKIWHVIAQAHTHFGLFLEKQEVLSRLSVGHSPAEILDELYPSRLKSEELKTEVPDIDELAATINRTFHYEIFDLWNRASDSQLSELLDRVTPRGFQTLYRQAKVSGYEEKGEILLYRIIVTARDDQLVRLLDWTNGEILTQCRTQYRDLRSQFRRFLRVTNEQHIKMFLSNNAPLGMGNSLEIRIVMLLESLPVWRRGELLELATPEQRAAIAKVLFRFVDGSVEELGFGRIMRIAEEELLLEHLSPSDRERWLNEMGLSDVQLSVRLFQMTDQGLRLFLADESVQKRVIEWLIGPNGRLGQRFGLEALERIYLVDRDCYQKLIDQLR